MKLSLHHVMVLIGSMLMASISGCGGNGTPAQPVTSTPKQFDSLEFTVSTTQSSYASGEPIPVTFTVKNTGTQTVSLSTGACSDYSVTVSQIQGQTVTELWSNPPLVGCVDKGRPALAIAPKQTVTFSSTWNQRVIQNANVPGGRYRITAELAATSLNANNAIPSDALTSNPVEVQVDGPCVGDPADAVPGEVVVGVRPEDDGEQVRALLSRFGSIGGTLSDLHAYKLELNPGLCIDESIAQLKPYPEIAYAEPNGLTMIAGAAERK